MKQPDNAPTWATHWCPPLDVIGNNPKGFWLGDMKSPFPLFQGVTWRKERGIRQLGGRNGLIFLRAIPLESLENE